MVASLVGCVCMHACVCTIVCSGTNVHADGRACLYFLQVCSVHTHIAATRCCNAVGCDSNPGGLCMPRSTTYSGAVAACASKGMRLCSLAELRSKVCCDTGCGYNSRRVWTADACGSSSSSANETASIGANQLYLSAYWDFDSCGHSGNDYHWDWYDGMPTLIAIHAPMHMEIHMLCTGMRATQATARTW